MSLSRSISFALGISLNLLLSRMSMSRNLSRYLRLSALVVFAVSIFSIKREGRIADSSTNKQTTTKNKKSQYSTFYPASS